MPLHRRQGKNLFFDFTILIFNPANRELMEAFAEQGHIASECITHVHPSDSDETFRDCNLTYAV